MTVGTVRWAVLALLGAVVAGGVALGFSLAATAAYTATATVMVSTPIPNTTTAAGRSAPVLDPGREVETNQRLMSLPVIAQRTAATIEGQTQSSVAHDVSISVDGHSYLYSVSATTPEPKLAALLANTYANQFVAFRSALDASQLDAVVARIRAQLGRGGVSPATTALVDLASSQVRLVQPAVAPADASSPRTARNTVVAAVLGLTLALALLLTQRTARRRPE